MTEQAGIGAVREPHSADLETGKNVGCYAVTKVWRRAQRVRVHRRHPHPALRGEVV
jgi:hypothetical protein